MRKLYILLFFVFLTLVSCEEGPSGSQIQNENNTRERNKPTLTTAPKSTNTPIPTNTFIPPTLLFTQNPSEPIISLPSSSSIQCIPQNTLRQTAYVNTVIDGDTISVSINHENYKVRYIGIDAPEQGDFYAVDATTRNAQLVTDKWVTLVRDFSETDQYGRLLRYVIVDNTFVNYALVAEGLAQAKDYPPDTACSSVFNSAENKAINGEVGFWKPTPKPNASSGSSGWNCDGSYPTVCILPPPPDLDCENISARNFTVYAPDPHNFDGDGDGIGCETAAGGGSSPGGSGSSGSGGSSGGGGSSGVGNCHPSYPTVCIPYPPPDLDCGDIPFKNFQVVGSDPHRFDGDGDGIGCEG